MAITVGRLDTLPWEPGSHPLEKKKLVPGRNVGLLEFSPGFADPIWCERSHVLYVIAGVLDLELDEGTTTVATGQCAVLDRGTRHRARNLGDQRAVVLIASDVDHAP